MCQGLQDDLHDARQDERGEAKPPTSLWSPRGGNSNYVSPSSPEHYIKVAERLARETPNSFMPNQYVNTANPMAHYETTGPEIWRQTGGKLDVFVCGMGTGGTISGTGRFLKEKKKTIRVVGVDPEGSIFYSRYHGTKEEP